MDVPSLKRIMYADDDPDLQDIVRMVLQTRSGMTVRICGTGRQALEEISRFQPDLLLLDMVLPDFTGTQLLEALQEIPGKPRVPVVFLTARFHPRQVEEYKNWGVIGVINKPLNPLTLTRQIREIWENRERK